MYASSLTTTGKDLNSKLFNAVEQNDLNEVKELVRNGANISTESNGDKPIHLAAKFGHNNIIKFFLDEGVNVDDINNRNGWTPLYCAAKFGQLDTVEFLIGKRADVNAKDRNNSTPLHLAAQNNHLEVIDILLNNCAAINAQTKKGDTPLHLAAENGYLKVVEALITKGADVNVKNQKDKTALNLAHKKKHPEVEDYVTQHQDKRKVLASQVDQHQRLKFNRRERTSGGMSGHNYEIKLSMWLLLQGITKKEDKRIDDFYLATNMKEAGDFDDVVFRYKYRDQNGVEKLKVAFLQAKHKDNPENAREKIAIDRLLAEPDKKDAFTLKDYFRSYLKVREQFSEEKVADPVFGGKLEDCDFIIYTNALPHDNFNVKNLKNLKRIDIGQEDILNFGEGNYYYELALGGDKKIDKEIIDVLQYASDSKILAKELVKSIFPNEKQKSAEIVNQGIIKKYNVSLAEKVIKKKKLGVFSESFLDGGKSLSSQDIEFRRVFFEEMRKKEEFNEKSIDELKPELQGKSIKLSDDFGNAKKSDSKCSLPNDLVSEDDVKAFLEQLKLFINQPNEKELDEKIKHKIKKAYGVEKQDIDSVFSDVKVKVESWCNKGDYYLTKDDRFFHDALRISIRFDVRDPVPLFTGRIEELKKLHAALQKEDGVVISQASVTGLGGVGKSELARKYISEHAKNYDDNVIWINAENYGTLAKSFRTLAQDKLKINTEGTDGKERDIESIVPEIYEFFTKRHRKSLFVFDNAGKYKTCEERDKGIDKFLPSGSNKPYILITSRDQEWGNIKTLPLGVFTKEEAVEFVREALKVEAGLQESEMEGLAYKLQYLPLALAQAVAYIKMENSRLKLYGETFTIRNYLDQYGEKLETFLDLALDQEYGEYTKTALTTWTVTVNTIKQEEVCGKQALEVLNIIAYLAPDKIPIQGVCSKLMTDKKVLRRAIELLDQYSLANRDLGVLNIHGLVQQVTRVNLKKQDREQEVLREALKLLQKPMNERSNLGSKYASHAVSAWNYASKDEELVKEFSELPGSIISRLNNDVRYEEACLFGKQSLDLLTKVLGLKHPSTLRTYNNMAEVLYRQGKYNEALQAYQEYLI